MSCRNNSCRSSEIRFKTEGQGYDRWRCGGQVELSGAVSSQYLTALLMAAPLAKGSEGITIKIRDELVSQPYVDMTVRLMERFGVKVCHAPSPRLNNCRCKLGPGHAERQCMVRM